jgi:hypothetical protein
MSLVLLFLTVPLDLPGELLQRPLDIQRKRPIPAPQLI